MQDSKTPTAALSALLALNLLCGLYFKEESNHEKI